jgi:hypothetical protein
MTAYGVKGNAKPVSRYSGRPSSPARPSTVNSATPPTTGGSTKGMVISARRSAAPGRPGRASIQASGTPMSSTMITETVAVIKDSCSACKAPAPVSTVAASVHGARITSPTSGKIKKSKATAAGTASSSGTRLCQDRSVAPTPAARFSAACAPTSVGSDSGLGKACLGQHRLALR